MGFTRPSISNSQLIVFRLGKDVRGSSKNKDKYIYNKSPRAVRDHGTILPGSVPYAWPPIACHLSVTGGPLLGKVLPIDQARPICNIPAQCQPRYAIYAEQHWPSPWSMLQTRYQPWKSMLAAYSTFPPVAVNALTAASREKPNAINCSIASLGKPGLDGSSAGFCEGPDAVLG